MHRGRKTIVLILIVAMLVQSMSTALIYLNFQVNRDYIAATLCVNRDKPITICGGSCYINKQLRESQESQQSEAPSHKKQLIETLYFTENFAFSARESHRPGNEYFIFDENFASRHLAAIFHPPRA